MGSEHDTEPAPGAPGAAATEGGFSLELSEDLRDMRGWVHDFAASVIRPAGSEWDEREETPWPIVEEASKIGLYSLDFFAQQAFEPSGLGIVVAFEELFWGDAGIALSVVGSSLAAVSLVTNGTNEQIGEWAPQMFGVPGDVKLAAFCSSEPDAGSDVGAIRTRAVYDEAKDEWVLNGTKTWATNGGIANVHIIVASVDPRSAPAGRPASSCRPAPAGCPRGRNSASTASAPRTPPRLCWTTSACRAAAWWAARTGWTHGSPGSARAAAAGSRPR
jgi:alkylation response protein AidB-like acyl-CoA dehydrogenase